MKKLLSGLLSLTMVFSLTPSTIAFADNEDNTSPTTQSEEGNNQETNDNSGKIGGAETAYKTEESSLDLNTMSSDELFEYLLNVYDMDALYEKYPNLNDLISNLSEDQQNQLAKKFGNSEEDVNLVTNNTDNDAQLASDNSNGDDSTVALGTCGDELKWTLDSDGTLTISGVGKMSDYNGASPWAKYNVTNIKINEGVTSIGDRAFRNDYTKFNITNVAIPSTVTKIGSYAFYGNASLTTITLPENLETIGLVAFAGCTSLTSIDIPSNVTSIGECAFANCEKLQSITIPSSVTTVEAVPFYGCKNVTNIYFNGTQSQWDGIKENVLASMGTTQEPSVHFFVDSGSCGDGVTWTLDGDGKLTISGEGTITKYLWKTADIKSIEIKEGVTSIGESAFYGCNAITSVTIPSTVKSIGKEAFYGSFNLTDLTIPNGVESIDEKAFYGCNSLTTLTLPSSLTTVADNAFYGCNDLTDIYFYGTQDQWDSIKENVLKNVRAKPTVHIIAGSGKCGDNLTWTLDGDGKLTISGTGAMYDYGYTTEAAPWFYYDVKTVVIEDGVTSIGNEAFIGLEGLTNIEIPESVESVGNYAFSHCKNLTSITLHGSLTTVNKMAFNYCTKVTDVYFYGTQDQWNNIKSDVVSNMNTSQSPTVHIIVDSGKCGDNLTWTLESDGKLTISGIGKMYDYSAGTAPWYKKEVTSVEIEEGVTTIGNYAFIWGELTSVTIPSSVETIGVCAFFINDKLTELNIKEGLTTIGARAFYVCSSLKNITIPDSVTTIGEYAFYYCENLESISLPCRFKNAIDSSWLEGTKVTNPTVGDHDLTEIIKKDATCKEDGYQSYWQCKKCQRMFTDENETDEITKPEVIEASHKYGKVIYTWSDDHKQCTATRECETCHDTDTETKDSTSEVVRKKSCTETELTKYSVSFTNKAFEAQTEKVETAKAKGHTLTEVAEIKATCTTAGQAAYWECSDCHKMFSDKNGNDGIESPIVIDALGHQLTEVQKVDATCTKDGHEAYWKCDTCKSMFSDSEGKNKIDKIVTIPATGHKYGKVTYTWSSDYKKCTATRECETCHHKDTETVDSNSEVVRNKSCTESELTKYSVTFTNDAFKAQTTEVETAEAKGHSLTKVDEIKATCEKDGSEAYWECSDCHKKFSDKDGNDEIESSVVIKALGHKLTEVKKVDATCTEFGSEAYWKCGTCKSLFSDAEGKNKIDAIVTIPATGHNLTKVSKQDSTASKEGNITYWYCDECDKYYSDEKAEKEINKADTVIAKVAPVIIKGDGVTVTVGEKKELSFTSDASYDDFIRAEVDGKILDSDNYTVKSGSTIVTLKSDYVASLEEGKHTLSIVSQSGTATAHFTVTKKKADPETKKSETTNTTNKSDSKQSTKKSTNTGVQSNMGLYISLIMISMIGLVVLVRRRSEQ